jgi:hypothetical protein
MHCRNRSHRSPPSIAWPWNDPRTAWLGGRVWRWGRGRSSCPRRPPSRLCRPRWGCPRHPTPAGRTRSHRRGRDVNPIFIIVITFQDVFDDDQQIVDRLQRLRLGIRPWRRRWRGSVSGRWDTGDRGSRMSGLDAGRGRCSVAQRDRRRGRVGGRVRPRWQQLSPRRGRGGGSGSGGPGSAGGGDDGHVGAHEVDHRGVSGGIGPWGGIHRWRGSHRWRRRGWRRL